MVKKVDMRKPLTPKILSNPNHQFVKTLIYIYSMQSFIFGEMNRASRNKDVDQIKFYGPLASALSFIVHCGNKKQTGLSKVFSVYRGLQVKAEEIESKYQPGSSINLQGFTSTTQDRDVAIKFALGDSLEEQENPEKCPVLIEIKIMDDNQLFYLNSPELSAYPKEHEILLQDGVEYQVIDCDQITKTIKKEGREYTKKITEVKLVKKSDKYSSMNCLTRSMKFLIN